MTVIEQAEQAGVIGLWEEAMFDAYGRDHRPSGWRIALVRPASLGCWEWAVRPLTGDIRRGVVPIAEGDPYGFHARRRAMDLADEALAAILVEAEEWAAAVAELEGR